MVTTSDVVYHPDNHNVALCQWGADADWIFEWNLAEEGIVGMFFSDAGLINMPDLSRAFPTLRATTDF
jgi:hypothetical protein